LCGPVLNYHIAQFSLIHQVLEKIEIIAFDCLVKARELLVFGTNPVGVEGLGVILFSCHYCVNTGVLVNDLEALKLIRDAAVRKSGVNSVISDTSELFSIFESILRDLCVVKGIETFSEAR
jgi:hypothetical protein